MARDEDSDQENLLQRAANISKDSPNGNELSFGYELEDLDKSNLEAHKRFISSLYPLAYHQSLPSEDDIEPGGTSHGM